MLKYHSVTSSGEPQIGQVSNLEFDFQTPRQALKETIGPDPHSPGSALPPSAYAADVGYLVDGTPLDAAGNNAVHWDEELRNCSQIGKVFPAWSRRFWNIEKTDSRRFCWIVISEDGALSRATLITSIYRYFPKDMRHNFGNLCPFFNPFRDSVRERQEALE